MNATNICTRCGSQWHDICHPAIATKEDEYGNVWELEGHFWLDSEVCPTCQSKYWKRVEHD